LAGAGLDKDRVVGRLGLHKKQWLAIGIHQGSGGHHEPIGSLFRLNGGHSQQSITVGMALHLAGLSLLLELIAMADVGQSHRSAQVEDEQRGGCQTRADGELQDPVGQDPGKQGLR
jgi:hypothetical protein